MTTGLFKRDAQIDTHFPDAFCTHQSAEMELTIKRTQSIVMAGLMARYKLLTLSCDLATQEHDMSISDTSKVTSIVPHLKHRLRQIDSNFSLSQGVSSPAGAGLPTSQSGLVNTVPTALRRGVAQPSQADFDRLIRDFNAALNAGAANSANAVRTTPAPTTQDSSAHSADAIKKFAGDFVDMLQELKSTQAPAQPVTKLP